MGSLYFVSVVVTSTFLTVCFGHVIKEYVLSFKFREVNFPSEDPDSPRGEKQRLSARIYKLLLSHVGFNDLILIVILVATGGIIWALTRKLTYLICFITGSVSSVIIGLLILLVCRKTSSKLVNVAPTGSRRVYNLCLGNSSALVILSLSLNCLVIFAVSAIFMDRFQEEDDIKLALDSFLYFAFGTLLVTLYVRISGALFSNALSILMQSDLKDEDQHKPLFDSMSYYTQNVYELMLETMTMLSTLFCTYYSVMGRLRDADKLVGANFGYLNFPVMVLTFSMFVTVITLFVFSFVMKNTSVRLSKLSYLYTFIVSVLIVLAIMPLFHQFFTPRKLEEIKYIKYVNYALVVTGFSSAALMAICIKFFMYSHTKPGRSVNLSVFTSSVGGVMNSLSFAKMLSIVPIFLVCLNLVICFVASDINGLLFVCIGFMCALTMVLIGSVFHSLIEGSLKFSEYCNFGDEERRVFRLFRTAFYDVIAFTRPMFNSMCMMLALVLLNHMSDRLELSKFNYFNPLVVVSLLFGCLFPFFQTGFILRISSAIANLKLRRRDFSHLLDELYIDEPEEDPEHEPGASYEKNRGILRRLKFWDTGAPSRASKSPAGSQTGGAASQRSAAAPAESEEVVVNVQGEPDAAFRTFGRAFQACLLREAGVKEDSLLNAPLMCSSARSTPEDFLSPALALQQSLYNNAKNAAEDASKETKAESPENVEYAATTNAETYKHESRDYRILRNADNHYKMFDSKYHDKHFNLRKKSTVASGSLEQLGALLPNDANAAQQPDRRSACYPSYELSDGVSSDVEPEAGDSLEQVYRRTEDLERDVNRKLNIEYYNQTSCGSEFSEKQAGSILKLVQNAQVHAMDPNSDDDLSRGNTGPGGAGAGPKKKKKKPKNRTTSTDSASPTSGPADEDDAFKPAVEQTPPAASFDSGKSSTFGFSFSDVGSKKSSTETKPATPAKEAAASPAPEKEGLLTRLISMDKGSGASKTDSARASAESAALNAKDSGAANIKVQKDLLPPDVGISNQPRRPTPKNIQSSSEFKDLEANSSKMSSSVSGNLHIVDTKTSSYQNTFISIFCSLFPFAFSLGFPILYGVLFGKNAVLVFALFSTITSSLFVQVLTFCSLSWEAMLNFMKYRRRTPEEVDQANQVAGDPEFKNKMNVSMGGRVSLYSIGPVLNIFVLALPLACILGLDGFVKFSNSSGFPSWSKIES